MPSGPPPAHLRNPFGDTPPSGSHPTPISAATGPAGTSAPFEPQQHHHLDPTTTTTTPTSSTIARPPPPPPPPLPSTYANKASGALARFGKAIYGTATSAPTTPPTPLQPSGSVSPRPPSAAASMAALPGASAGEDEIIYKARSEIIAMGPSPTENAVAVAGKDCK